jgi:DnaA family protein
LTDQLVLELAPPAPPTLDNFLPGANAAAIHALRRLVRGEETVVYLWGDEGCGKSHLVAAARRAAVVPLTALDDVDRLDEAGQVRAFDAFNAARLRGEPFLAAGRAPLAALALREDLRTRLGSGLVFHLHALADEEKADALRREAASRGIALAEDVLRYLRERLPRDLATQLAVLDALDRYSLARKRAITVPLAREALEALGIA